VDEDLEAKLYAALARRLPNATIVSIGHRSAILRLHQRHLAMRSADSYFILRDAAEGDSARAASPGS
jgi:putative ATP-binding cassette transporter